MRKTLLLGILVVAGLLMYISFAAAAQSPIYTASVGLTSNIIIIEMDTSFGSCTANSNCTPILESLRIQNTGNAAPGSAISGNFTTNVSTTYGLNFTTNALAGTNFRLNNTAFTSTSVGVSVVGVSDLGAGVDTTIPAGLQIPAGQAAGAYTGTVLLSWTV